MEYDLLEALAEKVHNSWWEEKKGQGYHLTRSHKDLAYVDHGPCNLCHPDMKPYSELSQEVKELNRVMVRQFEKHLEELGCYIVIRKNFKPGDPRGQRYG